MKRLQAVFVILLLVLASVLNVEAADPDQVWLEKYGILLANYREGNEGSAEDLVKFLAGASVSMSELEAKMGIEKDVYISALKVTGADNKTAWWKIREHKRHPVASGLLVYAEDPPKNVKIMKELKRR